MPACFFRFHSYTGDAIRIGCEEFGPLRYFWFCIVHVVCTAKEVTVVSRFFSSFPLPDSGGPDIAGRIERGLSWCNDDERRTKMTKNIRSIIFIQYLNIPVKLIDIFHYLNILGNCSVSWISCWNTCWSKYIDIY